MRIESQPPVRSELKSGNPAHCSTRFPLLHGAIAGKEATPPSDRDRVPLLHGTFQRFKFTQPKGFLLYGPPGCGKTLIGQAAAASLSKLVGESGQGAPGPKGGKLPVTRGAFLHVKGPEILNMWLGESERMVRDLFAQPAPSSEGLAFIFMTSGIDLGRAGVSFIQCRQHLVPMLLRRMGSSVSRCVIILADGRIDDPAVLRPGYDRKIQ